jgi:hypothetical protein
LGRLDEKANNWNRNAHDGLAYLGHVVRSAEYRYESHGAGGFYNGQIFVGRRGASARHFRPRPVYE